LRVCYPARPRSRNSPEKEISLAGDGPRGVFYLFARRAQEREKEGEGEARTVIGVGVVVGVDVVVGANAAVSLLGLLLS